MQGLVEPRIKQSRSTRQVAVSIFVASVLLSGVWAIGALLEEVYPAPIFPGFGRLPSVVDGEPTVLMIDLGSAEGSVRLSSRQFFAEAPPSFQLPMIDSLVASDPHRELHEWVNDRAVDSVGWDSCVTSLDVVEVTSDGSVVDVHHRLEFQTCNEGEE